MCPKCTETCLAKLLTLLDEFCYFRPTLVRTFILGPELGDVGRKVFGPSLCGLQRARSLSRRLRASSRLRPTFTELSRSLGGLPFSTELTSGSILCLRLSILQRA